MIISIHQPNFFPWYPFFEKIKQSDIFVILSNCQFEKNNYQNRFNYRDKWYTMSVNRGLEPIKDKKYLNHINDWNKIKINLKDKERILSLYDECISDNLAKTNKNIIFKTCDLLNIKTKIVFDYPTDLKSNERLIDLCKFYGADTYLAGSGGKNYMELEKFKEQNINVLFQDLNAVNKQHVLDIL